MLTADSLMTDFTVSLGSIILLGVRCQYLSVSIRTKHVLNTAASTCSTENLSERKENTKISSDPGLLPVCKLKFAPWWTPGIKGTHDHISKRIPVSSSVAIILQIFL